MSGYPNSYSSIWISLFVFVYIVNVKWMHLYLISIFSLSGSRFVFDKNVNYSTLSVSV
jgi:hypothetical protein